MSQHDYVIDNQPGASFRADLNTLALAIATMNGGPTAPATTYAGMYWADTANDRMKQRNQANSAWITLYVLSTGAPVSGVAAGPITTSGLTQATARMLGRSTAGTGAVEEISLASSLELLAGVMSVKDGGVTPAKLSQPFTLASPVATTSGTSWTITGIPSWAQIIAFVFDNFSTNGSSDYLVRGGSGSIDSAGYDSSAEYGGTGATNTTGFILRNNGSGSSHNGFLFLIRISGNRWVAMGAIRPGSGGTGGGGNATGVKTFSGALDRLQLTTVGGVDTGDNGQVTINYWG